MTLGRLMELYHAEQQGKQIMHRKYDSYYEFINEVKITECDLRILSNVEVDIDKTNFRHCFFIKDEEDKYGDKINKE